jgi:hypothetical protein
VCCACGTVWGVCGAVVESDKPEVSMLCKEEEICGIAGDGGVVHVMGSANYNT